jgi:hypothetical protein
MAQATASKDVAPASTPESQQLKAGARVKSEAEQNPVDSNTNRQQMVAEAAYFRAEHRHFEPGHELQDWFEAEVEIDRT